MALQNGDQQAKDELRKAYFPLLYRQAFDYLRESELANKLTNQVFDRFFNRLCEISTEKQAHNFLFLNMRDILRSTQELLAHQGANN